MACLVHLELKINSLLFPNKASIIWSLPTFPLLIILWLYYSVVTLTFLKLTKHFVASETLLALLSIESSLPIAVSFPAFIEVSP